MKPTMEITALAASVAWQRLQFRERYCVSSKHHIRAATRILGPYAEIAVCTALTAAADERFYI